MTDSPSVPTGAETWSGDVAEIAAEWGFSGHGLACPATVALCGVLSAEVPT